jgi:penicillin-binding protein 2
MAGLMAAVANGGTVYYPRLVEKVTDFDGNVKVNIPTRERAQLGVSMSDLTAVRQALAAVVENGTGRKAGIDGVKIAGKTGTAQFPTTINGRRMKDPRCWFYGFAPYENPRYVFCFLVEGGVGGGATAGPIAHDVLTKLFAMERGEYTPTMNYLAPAIGHFHGVQEAAPTEGSTPAAPPPPGTEPAQPGAPEIINENDDSSTLKIPVRRF